MARAFSAPGWFLQDVRLWILPDQYPSISQSWQVSAFSFGKSIEPGTGMEETILLGFKVSDLLQYVLAVSSPRFRLTYRE